MSEHTTESDYALSPAERVALSEAAARVWGVYAVRGEHDLSSVRNAVEFEVERIIAARLAPVQAVLDDAAERRLLCASDPDCSCSYKDCYECGKWHNCTHSPLNAVRDALRIPPGSPTGGDGDV